MTTTNQMGKDKNPSRTQTQISLRLLLIVPFILQIIAAVGLTGWLSFRNGQQAITNLATELESQASDRVDQHLDKYLAIPHQINAINMRAIELGLIDPKDLRKFGRYFWSQMKSFQDFGYLANILEPLDFNIIMAENGKQGLELANKNHLDLILTDIMMDIKTGLMMVRDLRQMPQFQNLPIIAISASIYEMMEPRCLEVGCNAFLPKPIDEEKLLSLIQQHLHLEWIYDVAIA
jgi:CheY-like chemotaxis protein